VRLIYDHRVVDGATVARALARLEEVLCTLLVSELSARGPRLAGQDTFDGCNGRAAPAERLWRACRMDCKRRGGVTGSAVSLVGRRTERQWEDDTMVRRLSRALAEATALDAELKRRWQESQATWAECRRAGQEFRELLTRWRSRSL
jgi:hypothetical protein